jgi:serine/threonine protein phosphatase 1
MPIMFFKKLDLSHARKVFVVGDIHGMFTLLEQELAKLDFDFEQDHLLSVGDLIDRGPESHLAVEYAQKPWFHFVLGNHEQLAKAHLMGHPGVHVGNGGAWFKELSSEDQAHHVAILNDAPVIMEVLVPSGRRIGLVHADLPVDDWSIIETLEEAFHNQWTEYCLWNRSGIQDIGVEGIKNIDQVYFGHTPLRGVYRMGNCAWIDTGACRTGVLTILPVK